MTETIPKPTDIDNGVPTPDATQLEEMFNQPTEGNEDSIDTTPQREPAESRIGNLLRRLAKGADTASEYTSDKAESIHDTLVSFGTAAKSGAEKAGKKVVGAGIATAEAVIGTGVIGAKFARKKVENALNTTKEVFNNSKDAVTNRIDEAKTNRESKLAERELRQKERQEQRRKEVQMKRDAALARKQERRDRWSARINSAKETVSGGIENARKKIHVIRAVGAEAIRAGREAYNTHTEQNELQ